MKKIGFAFIASCAVMATSHAQSTATIYGKLDLGYGITNGGDSEGRPGRNGKFQQIGNARHFSRWGIKGQEDLGNGYKVFFRLESLINPETGGGDGKAFGRSAYVGLSGNFGSVQAGRQETLHFRFLGEYDVMGGPNMSAAQSNVGLQPPQRMGPTKAMPRVDSALAYSTPTFSGFQGHALIILKNNDFSKKNFYSGALSYHNERFAMTGVYESKLDNTMGASWGIGAKYKFDSFTIAGGYFDAHYKDDGHGFYLGVSVPLNSFTVGGQVAYNTKAKSVVGGDKKLKPLAFSAFANYKLSKRTDLYSMASYMNNDAKTFMNAARKYSFVVGIAHNF